MSWETVRLGDWCPDHDIARWALWRRALDDFLWPDVRAKRAAGDVRGSVVFESWAGWRGVYHGLCSAGASSRYRDFDWMRDLSPPRAPFGGAKQVDELNTRWSKAWRSMVLINGNGRFQPSERQGGRGMKFCIVHLVLMYGLHDGSGPDSGGCHKLTSWSGVTESASLLLSLVCLRTEHPHSGCMTKMFVMRRVWRDGRARRP